MGYTHYWNFRKEIKEIENGDEKFKAAIALFKEGLKQLPDLKLGDGIGKGEPIINDECLCFNGSAELDEDYETFHIGLNMEIMDLDNFCKTARQPYDVAVCLALLCFKKVFGDDFEYRSDGYCPIDRQVLSGEHELEEGWQKAVDIMKML